MQREDGPGRSAPEGAGSGPGVAAGAGPAQSGRPGASSAAEVRHRRPLLERLGLALIAIVMASLFAAIALAAWGGGELFLAVAGAVGSLMTLWVGTLTLFRS